MYTHDNPSATDANAILTATLSTPRARRALLKGAIAGASSLAIFASTAGLTAQAQAAMSTKAGRLSKGQVTVIDILTVARTAEQLAVTFYSNGLANAEKLGLKENTKSYIRAALIEEQIHQLFFTSIGGQSLSTTFSFPKGQATFENIENFIETQQQLEGVFDSALLAAIPEFAALGRPELSRIAGQVACVEAEHRVLGRVILGERAANNRAFAPVLLAAVADVPEFVKKSGYLSPVADNSYTYQQVSIEDDEIEQRKPFAAGSTVIGKG